VNLFPIHNTIISRHLHAKERFAFAHKLILCQDVHITHGHIDWLKPMSSEVISFEDYNLTVADSKQTCISLALIVLVPLLTLEMITRTCNWHKQIANKFN